MSIQELESYLIFKGYHLIGCSNREITKIESFFHVNLPKTYREFLLTMGKSAGAYMEGSSVFYDEIFDLREGGVNLLYDDGLDLPDNAFIFWMHQGYQFAFFYINEGNDPPVFFYYEGLGKFEKKELSLTGFFESQIKLSGI